MSDYIIRCVICGSGTAEPPDRDPKNAIRTFSFGPSADELDVVVIVGVCARHEMLDTVDLRRSFYKRVGQAREWDTAHGLEIQSHE